MKKFYPYLICLLFSLSYSILGVVRHLNLGSFGFDLGIADQAVWQYSQFKIPLNTVYFEPYTLILADHVELIYLFVAPFYWLYSNASTLIILQSFWFCFSGLAVYLFTQKYKLKTFVLVALLCGYLLFYGVQNALWFDVHSVVFGAGCLAWLIYFLDQKKAKLSLLFCFLAIISKENIGLITFFIGFVSWLKNKNKHSLLIMLFSITYLFIIFIIYFPHFTPRGYTYQSQNGLLADLNPLYFFDGPSNREVIFTSLATFGFLPLLSPLYLLPFLADLFTYFVIANNLKEVQSIFMHYRVTLAPLLAWASLMTIVKFKKFNSFYIALLMIICSLYFQYSLHLPLSYLTKSWFWHKPKSADSINRMIKAIPSNARVVSQNNLTPHLTHRQTILTLWTEKRDFENLDFCGQKTCLILKWKAPADYLIVDLADEWDIRHFLANRDDYLKALENMEKNKIIVVERKDKTTAVYKILRNSF